MTNLKYLMAGLLFLKFKHKWIEYKCIEEDDR